MELTARPLTKISEIFSSPDMEYRFVEKVYSIQEDVDFIYDTFFKALVLYMERGISIEDEFFDDNKNEYIERAINYNIIMKKSDVLFGGMESSELKSPDCIKAHKNLPVPLFFGSLERGSFHQFRARNSIPPFIVISVHSTIYTMYKKDKDLRDISSSQRIRAKNEITEGRIKAAISHELSHWIDNSMYNIFNKIMGDEKDMNKQRELLLLKKKDVNLTYFELQGQIHGLVQLKKVYEKDWDTMTLNEVFDIYTSLHNVAWTVYNKYGKEVFDIWIRELRQRMVREGLLGAKMNEFSIAKMNEAASWAVGIVH